MNGEDAYYQVKEMMFEFMDRIGMPRPQPVATNKSNAKYYYRQAVRYGDRDAAERHKQRFMQLGGVPSDLPDDVKLAHPLSGLHKTLRYDFRLTLNDEEKRVLDAANCWYRENVFGNRV